MVNRWMLSTTTKMFLIGVLSLLLMIPLALVYDLVRERQGLASEAEATIARGWGAEQRVLLPMVHLVFVRERIENEQRIVDREERWLSAREATAKGALKVETRSLGMYTLPIYRADLSLQLSFETGPVTAEFATGDWQLAVSRLTFAPGDLTGLRQVRTLRVGDADLAFRPASDRMPLSLGEGMYSEGDRAMLEAPLGAISDMATLPVKLDIELAGARRFEMIPNASSFAFEVKGDWPHPGFAGGALPRDREVLADGFNANWQLLDLSTGLPPIAYSAETLRNWGGKAVGVQLVEPGGLYQQNERSAKYGVLVLALTMAALFLTEVLLGIRLHPFHYGLVGLALAMFYLLLLAISEHAGFTTAYLSAAAAVVCMVTGYCAAVMRSWPRGLLAGSVLAILKGFLFVLISAEQLSLLIGALGLTTLLAIAMYLTRRIDWYSGGSNAEASP